MIDEDNDKKLSALQAKQILKSENSVSYSRTINDVVREALKKK